MRSILKFTFVLGTLSLFALTFSSCTKKEEGSVINAVVQANIKGLDPIYANDTYSSLVVNQMYETLLHYHYLKRPLELQPLLTKNMPEVSKDGLTHTFKLRDDVFFHDNESFPNGKGRKIKASDFIFSWKRLADPRSKSDGFWVFDGRIEGLNEWREKVAKGEATYETPVEGLHAPDDNTLIIKLVKPYYQLHYVLAMTYTAVVPKEAVEKYGKEFINNPVGTGPFIFDSWIRNSKVVMVKNNNWRNDKYPTEGEVSDKENGLLTSAGQKLPFVDKLIIHEIVEDQPRWLNFMKGNIDFMSIPKDNYDTAVKDNKLVPELKSKGLGLFISREPDVTYTAFNMLDPVIGKNKNLRKAISLATDSKTLISKFYNGRAIEAHSPIPPDVDAYEEGFTNPYKAFDVSKAKEFLKKAGFPEGEGAPVIEYATTSSTTAKQMAEFFQQNMEAIGLKVKIENTSWPQFTKKIREKKAQVWGIAWMADYPDAENFLQLLYGGNISPGPNGSNYINKSFDKLYKKATLMPPGPERTKLYRKMRDIAVEDLPWVPSAHRLGYYLRQGWLKNYKRHSIVSDYFKYLDVDLKKKSTLQEKL